MIVVNLKCRTIVLPKSELAGYGVEAQADLSDEIEWILVGWTQSPARYSSRLPVCLMVGLAEPDPYSETSEGRASADCLAQGLGDGWEVASVLE